MQKSGWPRFGSVRLRFGDRTVRAVPVFGSRASSKEGVFVCFSTVSQRGRFRFQFRFLENGSGGSGSAFGSCENGSEGSGSGSVPEKWPLFARKLFSFFPLPPSPAWDLELLGFLEEIQP